MNVSIYFVILLIAVYELSSMWVGMSVCMCGQVYTCVWFEVDHGYVYAYVCMCVSI